MVSPKTLPELTYDEIIEAFETHHCPKRNTLASQHKFISTYQIENQSIADYISVYRRGIIDCEFISPCHSKASIADIFSIADSQFVRGLWTDRGQLKKLF